LNVARFSAASTIACDRPAKRATTRSAADDVGRWSHADASAHSAASAMIVVRIACYSRRRMPSPRVVAINTFAAGYTDRVVKRFGGQPIR
jgi:hypothetical protein